MKYNSKPVWDEAQIRCAINYTLEKCVILLPFHNARFKIQEAVIQWLYNFDEDVHQLSERDKKRKKLISCYQTNPGPQQQAENQCGDCPFEEGCIK